MPYLLNLAYLLLLLLLAPGLLYAACRRGKYRQALAARLLGRVPIRTGHQRCIWLHAVSVGEVNLLRPLLERISQRLPEVECVLSTTTRTGFDLARRRYPDIPVFYCPLDFSWAVRAAMRRVRPDLLILSELELWPNLIAAARRHGARIAVVNGRLSDGSFRGYRRAGWLIRHVLRRVDLIAAQSETYAGRFRRLGARPAAVHVTGSIKFDGARTDRAHPATQRLAELAGIGADDVVFLAGSTQAPEEALALEAYRALAADYPRLRLILVPRHPERFQEVAALLRASGLDWQRRSTLETAGRSAGRILLVDTIGELAAWWGTAQIAYVGGSMGARGGQNMIEPAAYAAAVSFGPRTENFRDVVQLLLERQAAVVVHDGGELTDFVRKCLDQPEWAADLGGRAQQLVLQQQGATDRTLEHLVTLLQQRTDPPHPAPPTGWKGAKIRTEERQGREGD